MLLLLHDWLFLIMQYPTSLSKHMLVQPGTQSCIGKFCSSVWSHSFVIQSLFWEDLSIEVVSHARYPKALLEGGHDCRLAACRLWHLKAVSRLMSPHENLMKKVFPKRCRLREQRKTLISHITAGKGKLKGAHKPHWHSEWAAFVLQINTSLTLAARQTFCIWSSHGVYGIFHSAPSQRSSLATSQKYSLFRAASFRQSRSRLWFPLFC